MEAEGVGVMLVNVDRFVNSRRRRILLHFTDVVHSLVILCNSTVGQGIPWGDDVGGSFGVKFVKGGEGGVGFTVFYLIDVNSMTVYTHKIYF